MKNPCFETLRRHDVKFRKACERSVRTREACEVRVKYRNFSIENDGGIRELDRAGFMRGVEEKDGGRLEATMPIADWTADV